MAEEQLQTSVFITNGTQQATRESVSGRPLLSTSSSAGKRPTSQTRGRSFMTSVPPRKVLLLLLILAVLILAGVIVAIVLTSTHAQQSSLASGQHGNDKEVCDVFNTVPLDSAADGHMTCSGAIQVTEGCISNTADSWAVFNNVSEDWNETLTYIPKEIDVFSSIVISPLFKLSPKVCSVQVSFSFSSVSLLRTYLLATNVTEPIEIFLGNCHYGYTDNAEFLSKHSSLRVLVISNSKIEVGGASASVTSHSCVKYKMLSVLERPATSSPHFPLIRVGERDVCTVEIYNSTSVDCHWWNVGDIDNGDFVRSEGDSCISTGAPSQNPHATWFLILTPGDTDSRAYVISPLIQGGSSHLILTLWHAIKCQGSYLRAYAIRSIHDIQTVTSKSEYLLEITGRNTTLQWKFESFQLAIPTNYKTFHIVLEGFTPANASCSGFFCYKNYQQLHPHVALVAIDKMSLEIKHDQCNLTVKNQSHELDCRFQDSNMTFTYCSWTSKSQYEGLPEFNSWLPDNTGDGLADGHGATPEHLQGRGYILSFDATGNFGSKHYLRSPRMIANSNCSCVMSLLYLLRGVWAPRLEVNLIYDDGSTNGMLVSHWSRHGHVSNDWETATVLLNLRTWRPFLVEILVKDVTDSKGDVHIDDLLFYECDMKTLSRP